MKDTLYAPPTILLPPHIDHEGKTHNWFALPDTDPVIHHLTTVLLDQEVDPNNWQVVRLSPAAYIYREEVTGWQVVVKFYQPKAGEKANYYAEREYHRTLQAWERLDSGREYRSVEPLGLWNGVIFLECVEGLTLENEIAVRRSQPGKLNHSIAMTGKLLAKLHIENIQSHNAADFGPAADYAHKLVDNLAKHGVLQNHSSVQTTLGLLIEKWATDPIMWEYQLSLNHGDATTSNFIFQPGGCVVAIDWERSDFADSAADLGRLMAEVTHSVNQYGGNFAEGLEFANALAIAYCNNLPTHWNTENLMQRARFYQASSTLRIARNGWLPRQDRLALVLQAFALLSK